MDPSEVSAGKRRKTQDLLEKSSDSGSTSVEELNPENWPASNNPQRSKKIFEITPSPTLADWTRRMSISLSLEVAELERKKNVMCLILSYPPMTWMDKEGHKNWFRNVLKINHKVRKLEKVHSKVMMDSVSELSSEIKRLMKHPLDNAIKAYVPPKIIEKMCCENSRKAWPKEVKLQNLALNFAYRQILGEIENPDVLTIRISGCDDHIRIASAMKNLPEILQRFDIVVQVDDLLYPAIEGIEEHIAAQLGFSGDILMLSEYLKTKSFLIILHSPRGMIDLQELGSKWWNTNNIQKIVCVTTCRRIEADVKIALEDHLLSWKLFRSNFGEIVCSYGFRGRAIDVVEKCSGHLLAVVLMARALEMASDISIWKHASYILSLPHTCLIKDRVLWNALVFVLGYSASGSAEKYVKYCAFYMEREEGMDIDGLIREWMRHALISTFDEGEKIVGDLVSAFLLERNGDSVRMLDEIRELLVDPRLLLEGRKGLTKAPKDEAWEQAFEIHLMNNKFSVLPNSPNCPQLCVLLLQDNPFLRAIPPSFFQHMPMLQSLDLSHTKLRSLPQSLHRLVHLQRFLLRGCKLLMELPPEIGELNNLKVLDFEGTEIIRLPVEVGKLTNLTCLKMSFYGEDDDYDRKDEHSDRPIIPQNVVSNLLQLEELIIDVSPDDKRWHANMKHIVKEVHRLEKLGSLQIYLPEVLLLSELWNALPSTNISGMHFKFTVGNHKKRIISRVPLDVAAKIGEQETYLKYVKGESFPVEIMEMLKWATAMFLERHSTATSLSEFGAGTTMNNLKLCVLAECDEIEAIVDADFNRYISFKSLECLNVYYMKNLRSIWKGKFQQGSLSCLKVLDLHTCPKLTTIFTMDMIYYFHNLEELVVEDCPKIESLIVVDDSPDAEPFLMFPRLKKISLHYLPRLVSIFYGLITSPRLEWMCVYDCASLKTLYREEVHSKVLRTITGEEKWWEELKRNDSKFFGPRNLDAIFFPIIEWDDKDFTTRLAEINIQHQGCKKRKESSQQKGPSNYLRAPALEDRTRSKQKQVA